MNEEQGNSMHRHDPGQFLEAVSFYRKGLSGKIKKRTLRGVAQAVAESLTAMANAQGGTVLLGAEPEGGILGTPLDARGQKLLPQLLERSVTPPLSFQVSPEEFEGRTLLRFAVQASPDVHVLAGGRCCLRVGGQNVLLSREKMHALKESRAETWHEREVLPCSSLADLDAELVASFLRRLGIEGNPEGILHRPYGLIAYREGRPLLTRAAVYLFGKDPLRWHAQPGIEFVRFEGKEKAGWGAYNIIERLRIEAPILRLVGEAERAIGARIKERVVLRDLFFREKFEYPAPAWREALINALAHRDYRLEGRPVEVWMFEDRLEIRSPGGLPGPVKMPPVLSQARVHYARNPLMSRVLADSGMMSSLGDGVPRIFREMEDHGLHPPELRDEAGSFCVVFRNVSVLDEEVLAWLGRYSGHPLNARQKHILAYAKAHGMIFSSGDYQKLGVSRDTAYTEIKDLVQRGIVEAFKKRGKVYRIRGAGGPAALPPGLDWVLEALEKKGFFHLQDLRQPASVSREKALEVMRDLAKQGYFTVSGKGRTAQYRPTEQLKLILGEGASQETE